MNTADLLVGRRVLIAEDDALVGLALADNLRNAGCVVVGLVTNGQAAEVMLESERLDFAILDVNLGGESIFPFANSLLDRGVPFFFLTGYARGPFVPIGFINHPWLEKPATDSLVLATAVKLLDTNRSRSGQEPSVK